MATVSKHRKRPRHWTVTVSLGPDPGKPGKYLRRQITLCPPNCPDADANPVTGTRGHSPMPSIRASSLAAARRAAASVEAQVLGETPRLPPVGVPTVADAAEHWLQHVANRGRSPATLRGYRKVVSNSIVPHLGDRLVSEVTTAEIEDLETVLLLRGSQKGGPLSPASVTRVHAALRSLMKHSKRRGWISVSPVDDVEPPRQSRRNPEGLDAERIQQFLCAADREVAWLAVLVRLAAVTGARRGELLALRWADLILVDEGGVVHIRSSLDQTRVTKGTKTHQKRTVPLPRPVVEILRAYQVSEIEAYAAATGVRVEAMDPHWFVFASPEGPDRPRNPDAVSRLVGTVAKRNNVGRFWLHGLRHFAASAMINGLVDPATAATVLGHSSPKLTLDTYASPFTGASEAAVETIWRQLS